jgi:hypothetical protein
MQDPTAGFRIGDGYDTDAPRLAIPGAESRKRADRAGGRPYHSRMAGADVLFIETDHAADGQPCASPIRKGFHSTVPFIRLPSRLSGIRLQRLDSLPGGQCPFQQFTFHRGNDPYIRLPARDAVLPST